MKTWTLIVLVSSFLLSGCGQQIEDFVRGGPPRNDGGKTPDDPSTSTSNPYGVKVSPGGNLLQGAALKGRVSITPWQRTVVGSQIKAKISLNQNRPE